MYKTSILLNLKTHGGENEGVDIASILLDTSRCNNNIWIGGITFILSIAIPSSRQVLRAEAGKLMSEIAKRFTPLANYSIALLVLSGIGLTGLNKEFSGFKILENKWTMALSLKHIFILGMIAIHFYRGSVLAIKIMRTASDTEKATLQKLSIDLVKVNFGLGMLVLLLSGILYVLRG